VHVIPGTYGLLLTISDPPGLITCQCMAIHLMTVMLSANHLLTLPLTLHTTVRMLSLLRESDHEYTQYFEQYQVYRLLSSIKRTSSGCEPIPYWVCSIEHIVTHTFNLTLSCGHPPAAWKHSIVTPIPNVNQPQQLSDFRALSLSLQFYLVASRLFVKHHFFPALPARTSKTSSLSVQLAALPMLLFIFSVMLRVFWCPTLMSDVFLSISARPSIRFVMKFYCWPISVTPDHPFAGIYPYAFLVMIADLQPSHPDICYSKYADDLTTVIPAAISHLAVSEFRHINDWSATNKPLINLSKAKEMIICRPGNRAKPTFPEPITGIEQIHTIKLMGVTFSDNLSFAPHNDVSISLNNSRSEI